jgi:DNA-directed RNA polymerase specialized sigma24 family protein
MNRVPLDEAALAAEQTSETLLALDEALRRFGVEEPEAVKIVELRYFAGLSIDEAADALGVSRATANRHWAYAKAWPRCELRAD